MMTPVLSAKWHRILTVVGLAATFLVPYASDPVVGLDPLLAARIGLVLSLVPTLIRIVTEAK